jgi:hypothetical protein
LAGDGLVVNKQNPNERGIHADKLVYCPAFFLTTAPWRSRLSIDASDPRALASGMRDCTLD